MYYSPAPQVAITTTNNKTHLLAFKYRNFYSLFPGRTAAILCDSWLCLFCLLLPFAHDSSLWERGAEAQEGARDGQRSPCWWAWALPVLRVGLGEQNAKWSQGQCRAQSPSSKHQMLQTGDAQNLPAPGLWLWHFGFFSCSSKIYLVWMVMASWGGDCSHQRGTFGLLSMHSVFSHPCKCSAGSTDETKWAV